MNILYALSGHGFGHAIRSKTVIEYLRRRNHLVKIITYSQGLKLMKKWFPMDTIEMKGYRLSYLTDRVFGLGITFNFFKNLPLFIGKNFPLLRRVVKNFQIQLIINDFEPFSRWFARATNLPLITVDNQLTTQLCRIDFPFKYFSEFVGIRTLEFLYPLGDYRFVTSFNPLLTPVKKIFCPNTFVVPPILRKEIFELQPRRENFILVYQTVPLYKKKLFTVFRNFPQEKFICYNLGSPSQTRNIILKEFKEREFLDELSRAKGVIINGGFTLMSEAIYLKKPILSLPIKGDFEQIVNGILLEKSGYGLFSQKIDGKVLKNFLNNLPVFEDKLRKYEQKKNIIFERKLERVLKKIELEI
ncbi:MAG: hypothetical protein N2259_03485 [Patescibacteria group bacterium]|nr:hypothetical protein [Patescibacteria group bacterium]